MRSNSFKYFHCTLRGYARFRLSDRALELRPLKTAAVRRSSSGVSAPGGSGANPLPPFFVEDEGGERSSRGERKKALFAEQRNAGKGGRGVCCRRRSHPAGGFNQDQSRKLAVSSLSAFFILLAWSSVSRLAFPFYYATRRSKQRGNCGNNGRVIKSPRFRRRALEKRDSSAG